MHNLFGVVKHLISQYITSACSFMCNLYKVVNQRKKSEIGLRYFVYSRRKINMQMIVFLTLVACAVTGVMCEDPECDGLSYNAETEICCEDGDIIDKPSTYQEGHKCCDRVATYDPATQICCSQTVHDSKPGALECCGSKTYNPKEEVCCVTSFGAIGKVKKDKETDNACCKGNPYDNRKEKC